jgi:SAM-dependent methyltransferase
VPGANIVPQRCDREDKAAVFREVARVLKPGGRMVVADIVLALTDVPGVFRSVLEKHQKLAREVRPPGRAPTTRKSPRPL